MSGLGLPNRFLMTFGRNSKTLSSRPQKQNATPPKTKQRRKRRQPRPSERWSSGLMPCLGAKRLGEAEFLRRRSRSFWGFRAFIGRFRPPNRPGWSSCWGPPYLSPRSPEGPVGPPSPLGRFASTEAAAQTPHQENRGPISPDFQIIQERLSRQLPRALQPLLLSPRRLWLQPEAPQRPRAALPPRPSR